MLQIQGLQKPVVRQNSPHSDGLFGAVPRNSPPRAGSGAVRKAAEAVRDANGDDAKSAAQKKLADLLSKSYDDDMAHRELELKQIEERLTKLRELLSRRRSKKQDIIDLQIKVALNDAEGLGFYENERPAKSDFRAFYYDYPPVPRVNDSSVAPPANPPTVTPNAEPFSDPSPAAGPEPAPSKDYAR
jgi:hypothetical protein